MHAKDGKELIKSGVLPRDIAVLGRTRSELLISGAS